MSWVCVCGGFRCFVLGGGQSVDSVIPHALVFITCLFCCDGISKSNVGSIFIILREEGFIVNVEDGVGMFIGMSASLGVGGDIVGGDRGSDGVRGPRRGAHRWYLGLGGGVR